MNVVLFGATGMVGSGVLIECLADERVSSVLSIGRRSCGVDHPRLSELILPDISDLSEMTDELKDFDACFFCLGVSAAGMGEEAYRSVTLDLTLTVARTLAELNPGMIFCYVSGQGTDSSGEGRFMWARVKGETENELLAMPSLRAFMFRPGFIQPLKGVRSKTRLYQAAYVVLAPLYPVLRRLLPGQMTTTENVGRAMIEVAAGTDAPRIFGIAEINAAADRGRG